MRRLSDRNETLLLSGQRIGGNFTDGYEHIKGDVWVHDSIILRSFCKYLDGIFNDGVSFSIKKLFISFAEPHNSEAQKYVKQITKTTKNGAN